MNTCNKKTKTKSNCACEVWLQSIRYGPIFGSIKTKGSQYWHWWWWWSSSHRHQFNSNLPNFRPNRHHFDVEFSKSCYTNRITLLKCCSSIMKNKFVSVGQPIPKPPPQIVRFFGFQLINLNNIQCYWISPPRHRFFPFPWRQQYAIAEGPPKIVKTKRCHSNMLYQYV